MNRFKDEQGRTWLVTPLMAKALGVTAGALSNYKYDGTLKRGVHWVQQTTGHRRVFYNVEAVTEWWTNGNPAKVDGRHRETKSESTGKKQICSIYLQDDLAAKLREIQKSSDLTVKTEIDGVVLEVVEQKPKLNTIVNMLLAKAIKAHFEERVA